MNARHLMDLSTIGRGFGDVPLCSQDLFRCALSAMSRPGTIMPLDVDIESPDGLYPGAAAVLLALLDQDTRLWLSAGFDSGNAAAYLRFHTGCVLSEDAASADFVLARPADMPELACLSHGSEEYPERSATVVIQTDGLSQEGGWRLSGPGIEGHSLLSVSGLENAFLDSWRESQRHFPCGIDLFFASHDRLAAMPRTTRAEV